MIDSNATIQPVIPPIQPIEGHWFDSAKLISVGSPNFELTKVDPNRLLNVAGNIESSLGSLANSFRRIDAALQNVLAPTWESPAKQMFFGQYANDIQLFNNQLDVLGKFNEQLKAAAGIFANADSSVNDAVNKLQVGN
jgi:WXG100 family type VII secretion target